jgi:hypothetical protein
VRISRPNRNGRWRRRPHERAAGDHHDLSRAAALEQRLQGGGSDRSGPDHTHPLPTASAVTGEGRRRQGAGSSARVAPLRVADPDRAVVHGRRPDLGCRVRRTGRAGRLGTKNSVPATAVEKSRIRSCAAGGPVRLVAGRHDTAQPIHDLGSQRAGQFQSHGPDALDCLGVSRRGVALPSSPSSPGTLVALLSACGAGRVSPRTPPTGSSRPTATPRRPEPLRRWALPVKQEQPGHDGPARWTVRCCPNHGGIS